MTLHGGNNYITLVETSPDAIVVYCNNRILYANPAAVRLAGASSQEQLRSQNILDLVHPDDKEQVKDRIEQTLQGKTVPLLPERFNTLDGKELILETVSTKITYDGAPAVLTILHDVTERKKIEEKLKTSERLLAQTQQVACVGSWEWNIETQQVTFSEELYRIFGIDKALFQLSVESFLGLIHPDDRTLVAKSIERTMSDCKPVDVEYQIILPDGSVHIVHAKSMVSNTNKDGVPIQITGMVEDITERKKAEEALKNSEMRFRLVAEAADIMVYETDVSTGKATVLRGSKELIGYKPEEIDFTVDWVLSRIHPDDAPRILANYKAALEKGRRDTYSLEYRFLHKNGCYITVKDTAKAVRDSTGKTIRLIGGIHDITERKLLQQKLEDYAKNLEYIVEERTKQLRDSERLATIGQVAGMIGHDIRNPLQAAVSELYFAKETITYMSDSKSKTEALESIKIIEDQTDYISKIVSDLQDYARPLKPALAEVDLCQAIPEALKTIVVPENIQAGFICEELIPKLKLDLTFLRRVLTNLASNAIQAMPDGGRLLIKTSRKDDSAFITVEDTGRGIPEAVKPKLFTPLFTTKSKGQGFGLAVVKRLVEAQEGTISFESQEGKGTIFVIEFPIRSATETGGNSKPCL